MPCPHQGGKLNSSCDQPFQPGWPMSGSLSIERRRRSAPKCVQRLHSLGGCIGACAFARQGAHAIVEILVLRSRAVSASRSPNLGIQTASISSVPAMRTCPDASTSTSQSLKELHASGHRVCGATAHRRELHQSIVSLTRTLARPCLHTTPAKWETARHATSPNLPETWYGRAAVTTVSRVTRGKHNDAYRHRVAFRTHHTLTRNDALQNRYIHVSSRRRFIALSVDGLDSRVQQGIVIVCWRGLFLLAFPSAPPLGHWGLDHRSRRCTGDILGNLQL